MKKVLMVFFILTVELTYAQNYVDSGIQLYMRSEYDEALVEFGRAAELKNVLTNASIAKIHYYEGLTWMAIGEKSIGKSSETDPLKMAFDNLTQVSNFDKEYEERLAEAHAKLSSLLIEEADSYLKNIKKAKTADEKLPLMDLRIKYLQLAKALEVSSMANLYLGETNKEAGDVIFEESTDVVKMQRAKTYYEEALKFYELARYDDPFSKNIIEALLIISERLGDPDRVKEYTDLLKLADG